MASQKRRNNPLSNQITYKYLKKHAKKRSSRKSSKQYLMFEFSKTKIQSQSLLSFFLEIDYKIRRLKVRMWYFQKNNLYAISGDEKNSLKKKKMK